MEWSRRSLPEVGLAVVCALAMLSGCTPETRPFSLAPISNNVPYQPSCQLDPEPQLPSRFPFPSTAMPVKLPASSDEELSLADLIDLALYNSPKTQETWATARVAAAKYGESRSYYYPDINGFVFGRVAREADFYGTPTLHIEQYGHYGPRLEISWLLLDLGTRKSRAAAFREQLMRANWAHNREIQTVIEEVMLDYFGYMTRKGLVLAARADLADAETNLNAAIGRFKTGVDDVSDVAFAKTLVAQRELALLTALENLEITQGQLTADMGIPSTEELTIQELPETLEIPTFCSSVDQLLAAAYHVRPDLFASWANVRSKTARVDEAIGKLLPQLTFFGHVGRVDFVYPKPVTDHYDYQAQLTLEIPLFEGFHRWNRVKEARAALERAKAELRQLEVSISQEVVVSYRTFKLASQKVKAGKEYVEAAEISYQAALSRYKVGTVDIVALANAFSELADARAAFVVARQDFFNSMAELAYSVGSLEPPESDWRTRICR